MKKGILLIPIAAGIATVVTLGVLSIKTWSWDNTAKNKEINYCLLIGQTDHNDSAARTGGVRNALGTRPIEHLSNPNIEVPKQGKLRFSIKGKESEGETYTVNELEHKVCIADSGATWDQATAINISNTWYSKYPNKITMMISNNDGMAEGALFSLSRPEGMPIFGYDSNESTLKLIKENKITGTINSNAPAQAAAINIIARRIIDGDYVYGDESKGDITKTLFKGFSGYIVDDSGVREGCLNTPSDDNKYVKKADPETKNSGYITDVMGKDIEFYWNPNNHSILVSSNGVMKDNADNYLKTASEQAQLTNTIDTPKVKDSYDFFECAYSQTDTYLNSTMNPLVSEYRKQFGIDDVGLSSLVYGNGNDETKTLDAIGDRPAQDAYIINMTKTINADKYIKKIYDRINNDEQYRKTPIIFYNRQPTTSEGKVDPKYLIPGEDNHYNPYVFYIGFDADAGATLQGDLVIYWLKEQYGKAHNVEDVDSVYAEIVED